MNMLGPICLVTGSSRGLGLELVRALCKRLPEAKVYLTALTLNEGNEAVKLLDNEGLQPMMRLLDVRNKDMLKNLRDELLEDHGGLDILINNAGIAFKPEDTETFAEKARVTLETNYWGNRRCCEVMFPILRSGARVVNMSSSCGFLGHLDKGRFIKAASQLKDRLGSKDITIEELDDLMKEFEKDAETGTHMENGWPDSTYVVSKIGFSALSRIQQRVFDSDIRTDLVVNHVHPGYLPTYLTGFKGSMTVEEGVAAPLYAALLPPETSVRGQYIWKDCSIVDWVNGPAPSSSSISGKLVMP